MKNPKMLSFFPTDLPIFRVARGVLRVEEENLFFDQKTTNDQKCSKFSEIWAGGMSLSTMLLQGSLSQNLKRIGPFPPFKCLGQPCFEYLYSRFTHMHAGPVVILHVSEHVLFLVSLGQQLLQMSIDPEKHSLSLDGCQITGSLAS